MRLYQHQRAANDSNGNPRRLYVVTQTRMVAGQRYADIVAVYDEGYRGLPKALRAMCELSPVNIEPSDYRATLLWARHDDRVKLHNG